ncbi:hypothetical protein MJT46_009049 [Ovis ammon polii x Ovis aries]|nr:hypothetical protein MJT46_009049 [Ovis ammon polii x Ovis aries]
MSEGKDMGVTLVSSRNGKPFLMADQEAKDTELYEVNGVARLQGQNPRVLSPGSGFFHRPLLLLLSFPGVDWKRKMQIQHRSSKTQITHPPLRSGDLAREQDRKEMICFLTMSTSLLAWPPDCVGSPVKGAWEEATFRAMTTPAAQMSDRGPLSKPQMLQIIHITVLFMCLETCCTVDIMINIFILDPTYRWPLADPTTEARAESREASECHIKENSVEPCRVPTDHDPHGCPVFQMHTREEGRVESRFPDQGANVHRLHRMHRVLTTGPPGPSRPKHSWASFSFRIAFRTKRPNKHLEMVTSNTCVDAFC